MDGDCQRGPYRIREGDAMERIPGYDEWKITPPESLPVARCDNCGCELWEGDWVFEVDGEKLCEDCVKNDYGRIL